MTEDGKFTEEDVRRLMLAATYTGKELSTVLMQQEIERTQKEIIFTMAEAGEMRSKETGHHVKRVAEYSYILAIGCGMNEKEAELLKMASPMHDIGKVAIPDSILLKPGKLTDEEWDVMRSHALMGYNILKHSERKILKAAATVALTHHEKWNGKGYPYGLAGEDIHLFGRITAIADVFDALGSDRVYKKAWELDRILELFREESGQHFDPALVKVFFDNLDKFLEIRETYKDAPDGEH
jgi:response regulator RpfG family c-di-GMP phosphodiesterase